ncbi:MAG: dihydroorotate dehydrogenase (quinone) [Myxococcales bacterium]
MSTLAWRAARAALFRLDPERAHGLTLRALRLAGALGSGRAVLGALFSGPGRPVSAFGLTFPNAVGVAAGYDKDALALHGLAAMGFGHVEVGTVTPRAQPGNPRPRLFRLPEDRAVVNRLGFPGEGAGVVAARLRHPPAGVVVGVNIGKQKDTPLEAAAEDYAGLVTALGPLAGYLAVNVSSPNTVGLRRLQARDALEELLRAVGGARDALPRRVPVLVKLAPDLTDAELDDALGAVEGAGMDGVIATNTTLSREGLRGAARGEAGGLSGAPLRARSAAVLAAIVRRTSLPVISAGGIDSPDEACRRLDAGARLVQLYTGLIYEGPGLLRRTLRAIASRR